MDARASIEGALEAALDGQQLSPALADALRYATLGGGKRLRPLLAWESACAVGGLGEASLPAGVAVELVHCFSLVHDDLPSLDNDDLRRGRPTLHRHAGEAMAILAGDGLLTLAMLHLARHAPPPLAGVCVAHLARATLEMIAGQAGDTTGDVPASRQMPLERLRWIHDNKTGALLRAACGLGALLGGANPAQQRAIEAFGTAAGRLFQAVDDLLDVTQTSETAGKRTGKDAEAGKLTYPGVLGVQGTRVEIESLRHDALAAIKPLGEQADGLRTLLDLMARRTN